MSKLKYGFTLIEMLVVITIISVLLAISLFGIQGVREASRDAKRKSDLQLTASQLETYKSDCNYYPISLTSGSSLMGSGTPTTCLSTNTYIQSAPSDPVSGKNYVYVPLPSGCASTNNCTGFKYWTSLENGGSASAVCGTAPSGCGTGILCNYCVTNL